MKILYREIVVPFNGGGIIMTLPLEGIRVLDLSRYLPGPFCTQVLADFGAEVIKVEDPKGGDLGRWLPPLINGESARFYTVNRNKKSITLDMRQNKGKEILKKLVADCDVVIDQFRPGVMDKLGLGYEVLCQVNPAIIYCAITGYGQNGPMRDAAGHDLNYLSLSGVIDLTGTQDGKPAMSGVQIADVPGGTLYAIISILLALLKRNQTGKGDYCDIAMLDGAVSLLAYTLGEWSGWGKLPERGNDVLTGGYACYNVYPTRDKKYVTLGAIEDKFWAQFCNLLQKNEYVPWQWEPERQKEIKQDITEIMLNKDRDEWVEFFADHDICFTPVLNLEEMVNHPQIKARDMIYKLENVKDSGKEVVLTGIPIKLSDTPGEVILEFPELGEHNEEILLQAGFSRADIEEFQKDKVI